MRKIISWEGVMNDLDKVAIWHYAAHMAPSVFMEPACLILREDNPPGQRVHGMTKIRGDVNCPDCQTSMGMPNV